ncbi:MAG: hypothetical protein LBD37_03295 [Treponema sp.]|nr:hypothetical protein [Treponema sp.]
MSRYWVFIMVLLAVSLLGSCWRNADGPAIIPPPTPVLSRSVIGFGVINASYAQVLAEPYPNALSVGYFRRNAIVEVLERRSVRRNGMAESWVFVAGTYRGWLRDNQAVVRIYNNEAKAKTAAESAGP